MVFQSGEEGETRLPRESSSERLNRVKRRFQKVLAQHEPGGLPTVQRARPNQVQRLSSTARDRRPPTVQRARHNQVQRLSSTARDRRPANYTASETNLGTGTDKGSEAITALSTSTRVRRPSNSTKSQTLPGTDRG
jgi:hypothetical protein